MHLSSPLLWPGYYCPTGTGDLTQFQCASPTTYCPAGASLYSSTQSGYYAVAGANGLFVSQSLCEAGRYCVAGVAQSCTAGRYGASTGMTNSSCTGVCQQGYYCAAGSASPQAAPCGSASRFCPEVRLWWASISC